MPISKENRTYASRFKTDVSVDQTTNTGFDSTVRLLVSGDGASSAASLSDDVLSVKPVNDNTTGTMLVKNQGGSNIFAVDTTNSKLLGGAAQTALNTNYAHFGIDYTASSSFPADTHMAVPFGLSESSASYLAMGSSTSSSFNDTNPATSLTLATTAHSIVNMFWHIIDDITVDAVIWWSGADAATGDDIATHLMAYTVDSANGSTGGDLSSGIVVADGATLTNAGYEQAYYQSMTVQSANVDAGKVIMFTFASDTVNADYSINATVKYHIR